MLHKPVSGGENQAPLLGGRNAGGGTAIAAAGPQPDFNECGGVAVLADQVNLAAFDAEVAVDDAQPLLFQMAGRA